MDGTWNATSFTLTEDGTTTELLGSGGFVTSASVSYSNCKLKNDEFCNSSNTIVTPFGTETTTNLYRVTNDGTTMEVKESDTSAVETVNIVELNGFNLTIDQTDGDGDVTRIVL